MSTTDVDAATIYAVVKTAFDNFDAFKEFHPAFSDLEPNQMVHDGLSAPLHDGARRYYQEMGLM